RRTHIPVFLDRAPEDTWDASLAEWHHTLVTAAAGVRTGTWELLDVHGWPDNTTCENLLAWSWTAEDGPHHLVVVNLSPIPAQGRVRLPWTDLAGRRVLFTDVLRGESFYRDGDELSAEDLYVALDPWCFHVFAVHW
ncbi:MAG: alpha-amylase, partial [Umezawaea sp.]